MPLTVVGPPDLRAALAATASGARVVVVGGPVAERGAHAEAAVRDGAHVFVLWPPGPDVAALAALADEAGVEVGVARPLGLSSVLAGLPAGWSARLVTVGVVARPDGPLGRAGWRTLLAGAFDVCLTLADARDATRLDAVAERDGDALRAVALAMRFPNGAYAQATVRFSDRAGDDLALYASRPGSRVEARSLDGPLCIEADGETVPLDGPPHADALVAEVAAFARAADAGRRAPYPLDRALATQRLADRVREQLR